MVFIVCWNVAGWASTVERVRTCFPTLADYFRELGADIVALQEVKASWEALRKKPFIAGACDQKRNDLEGWESFWACSEGLRGFNGVATFAKKGLVLRADASPFESQKLNNEGRCIVTYHSAFVLVNVYVVNGRGGERQDFKTEFLNALRGLLRRLRSETGLPVVLCGDMNLTYRAEDAHWSHQRLMLRELCWAAGCPLPPPPPPQPPLQTSATEQAADHKTTGSGADDTSDSETDDPEAVATRRRQWLETLDALAQSRTPEQRGAARRVMVAVARHLKGSDEHRELLATFPELPQQGAVIDEASASQAAAMIAAVVHTHKRTNVWFSQFLTYNAADSRNLDYFVVSDFAGAAPHPWCDRRWVLRSLMKHDGMVDAFALLYPRAHGCATCWDQSRNKRYENIGNRIDYFFVDAPLVDCISRDPRHLQHHLEAEAEADRADITGACGVRRVTANGRYKPAPTVGPVGLEPLAKADAHLQFHGLPSSGLFISPPQFSDHIGVTLVLNVSCAPRGGQLDANSLKCMYRGQYKETIMDLFAKRTASLQTSKAASTGTAGGGESQAPSSSVPSRADSGGIAEELAAKRAKQEYARRQDDVVIVSDDD